jgi:uncharacterized RDD family membrane protein YckC
MAARDPFAILQVSPDAEPEIFLAAYRTLARKYHPDVCRDPASSARMAEINWARDELENNADAWRATFAHVAQAEAPPVNGSTPGRKRESKARQPASETPTRTVCPSCAACLTVIRKSHGVVSTTPAHAEIQCSKCEWWFTIDQEGHVVDGKPIKTVCPSCAEGMEIHPAGHVDCRKCGWSFDVDEHGRVVSGTPIRTRCPCGKELLTRTPGRVSCAECKTSFVIDNAGRPTYDRAYKSHAAESAHGDDTVDTGELAGFWRRAGAFLADCVVYGVCIPGFMAVSFLLIGLALYIAWLLVARQLFMAGWNVEMPVFEWSIGQQTVSDYFSPFVLWGGVLWGAGLGALGYVGGVAEGQTEGCGAFGLKIVRCADGEPPGYPRALARVLVSVLSRGVLWLGYLWMLWDDKHQTWHDRAAGTMVVRAPRGESS